MPRLSSVEPIIQSLLEDDLYKVSMQAAVVKLYDDVDAEYTFFNRGGTPFPDGFASALQSEIDHMKHLRTTTDESAWMRECPSLGWIPRSFVDFHDGYRLAYDTMTISQDGGSPHIQIIGPWYKTIRWEVPLMAVISELFFKMTNQAPDLAWLRNSIYEKARIFASEGLAVTDFGTRRRYSGEVHDFVVGYLADHCKTFMGTSNLYLARKHKVRPIGTHAHEWFMAHAAMFGVEAANRMALEAWLKVYGGRLGTALTDTFTTEVFLRDFGPLMARQFDGVRQDSGDPIAWGHKMIRHYESLGIDPTTKLAIFSDALDVGRATMIQREFRGKTKVAFGIGTNLTNDVGVKPLNMVIKATAFRVNGRWIKVAKLSDDPGKNTGEVVALYKQVLGVA